MRRLTRTARVAVAVAAPALAAQLGCNAIFGLDEVSPLAAGGGTSTSTTTGSGAAGGGGAGGTGGGGAAGGGGSGGDTSCPDPTPSGNLVANGSFEVNAAWTLQGKNVALDYLSETDCAFACGDRVGHITGETAAGETSSINVYQTVSQTLELGGKLHLDAHYDFVAGGNEPYFDVSSNGYPIGPQYIKGTNAGAHKVVDAFEIPIADPRRTGTSFLLTFSHPLEAAQQSDMRLDCVAMTYEPPDGTEVLSDGWLESGTSAWVGANNATLSWEALDGLCGHGAGKVLVPAGELNAEIRSAALGSWPSGTSFQFAGAVMPLPQGMPAVFNLELRLFLKYEDDQNGNTLDYEDVDVSFTATSEPWRYAVGTKAVTRPVTDIALILVAANNTGADAELLADCFTVRAVTP